MVVLGQGLGEARRVPQQGQGPDRDGGRGVRPRPLRRLQRGKRTHRGARLWWPWLRPGLHPHDLWLLPVESELLCFCLG